MTTERIETITIRGNSSKGWGVYVNGRAFKTGLDFTRATEMADGLDYKVPSPKGSVFVEVRNGLGEVVQRRSYADVEFARKEADRVNEAVARTQGRAFPLDMTADVVFDNEPTLPDAMVIWPD